MTAPVIAVDAVYAAQDGTSAITRVTVPLFVVGGPDVVHGAEGWGISEASAPTDWGDWHITRNPMLSIVLSGSWEVAVSSGETRLLQAGSLIVMLDTHGAGHRSRVRGAHGCSVIGVRLDASGAAMLADQIRA